MLITYPDCMGNDFKDLAFVLDRYLEGAVGGLHILPFFPSSADRGFSPTTYREVDPRFGDWEDIRKFSEKYYLMYDYMINHISDESEVFKDFIEKKDESEYRDFFIRYKDFWEGGEPTEEQDSILYKRKEHPYVVVKFKDGTSEKLWSTFSDHQIDINCQRSEVAKKFLRDNLEFLSQHGAAVIRLDAFAYASKKAGTDCFFVEPDVWELIGSCRDAIAANGVVVLPEIHENYFIQKKLEEKGYRTYDFQLPMLVLNAVFYGKTLYLKDWMKLCPRTQFTTLDTHDGIGVVDVRYLMPDDEVLKTKKHVFELNPGISEVYAHSNTKVNFKVFDTYQINCTYYSALGESDEKYFLARAVQFFAPGIPQVYYVGLFAGRNDFEFVNRTNAPRDINRHYFTLDEVEQEFKRPIVRKFNRLMKLRNNHPAFNGDFILKDSNDHSLCLRWENGKEYAELYADFETFEARITYTKDGGEVVFDGEEA